MSEENVAGKPQGKGLAVGGFVLSLVGFVLSWVIYGIALASVAANMLKGESGGAGILYFWVVLCIGSIVLSAMGMVKLKKSGGKRGLAIAGLIIGIVATVWTIMLVMGVEAAAALMNGAGGLMDTEMQDALDALNELN